MRIMELLPEKRSNACRMAATQQLTARYTTRGMKIHSFETGVLMKIHSFATDVLMRIHSFATQAF